MKFLAHLELKWIRYAYFLRFNNLSYVVMGWEGVSMLILRLNHKKVIQIVSKISASQF
jgi:hypothetical protein